MTSYRKMSVLLYHVSIWIVRVVRSRSPSADVLWVGCDWWALLRSCTDSASAFLWSELHLSLCLPASSSIQLSLRPVYVILKLSLNNNRQTKLVLFLYLLQSTFTYTYVSPVVNPAQRIQNVKEWSEATSAVYKKKKKNGFKQHFCVIYISETHTRLWLIQDLWYLKWSRHKWGLLSQNWIWENICETFLKP